jgi:hypothetical protein
MTTLVVAAIALVELVALIAIGAVRLTPKHAASHAAAPAAGVKAAHKVVVHHAPPIPSHPLRPRSHVHVLVLNANGVQGAAAGEASHLSGIGYRIAGAENAQKHNYARSMVLYVPGWIKEARRLAHDTGIHMVAPVDGLRRHALKGSQTVVILGN